MHLFTIMYLVGLLIGVGFYALTYYFSKDIDFKIRATIIAILGLLILSGSLTIIGGFEGMPFGVISIGIFTVAILLFIFGKKPLLKKGMFTVIVLFVLCSFAFSALYKIDYWVIKKTDQISLASDDLGLYVNKVQNNPQIRGYETFTISEGSRAVVLSLGEDMSGSNIEVLNVDEIYGKTIINVRSFYNKSQEPNPTIIIGLDRLQAKIEIIDTDGTLYEHASN